MSHQNCDSNCEGSMDRLPAFLPSPFYWGGVILLTFLCCLLLTCSSNFLRSFFAPVPEAIADSVSSSGGSGTRIQSANFQRIREKHGAVSAEYGFRSYNNDSLNVTFSISVKELSGYRSGYGYTSAELDDLMKWQKNALNAAYKASLGPDAPPRAQVEKLYETIRNSYQEKYRALLHSRGFVLRGNNVISVNMPSIIARNIKHVRPVAAELAKQGAARGYDSDDLIGAALSLSQTALEFEDVPAEINGRKTGGLLPPVEALVRGRGDCDTKSALLASILLNWDRTKLVGVVVPSHYLIGILRNPARGEAFVEFEGLRYVLLEPAGPAWLPAGSIGPETEAAITVGRGVRIEAISGS